MPSEPMPARVACPRPRQRLPSQAPPLCAAGDRVRSLCAGDRARCPNGEVDGRGSVPRLRTVAPGAPAGALQRCRHLVPRRTGLDQIEAALDARGIGYRVESASLIFRSQEVRNLLALCRAIDSPGDELALVAALRSPAFACGDDDLRAYRAFGGRWSIETPPPRTSPASPTSPGSPAEHSGGGVIPPSLSRRSGGWLRIGPGAGSSARSVSSNWPCGTAVSFSSRWRLRGSVSRGVGSGSCSSRRAPLSTPAAGA